MLNDLLLIGVKIKTDLFVKAQTAFILEFLDLERNSSSMNKNRFLSHSSKKIFSIETILQ